MADNGIIQSVQRTFKVIYALCGMPEGLSLTQLSENVGLHKSTVSRILNTLKTDNLIKQNNDSLKYSLGNGFLEISLKYLGGFELRKISYPYMQKLQEVVGETINLAILDFDEIIYIERVVSPLPLRHSMKIGDRAPACSTALGKAMLAFSEEVFVKKILSGKALDKNIPRTKVQIDQFLEELSQIRSTKIAFDNRIHQEHIRCLGSAIINSQKKVFGAISVSGPASRMSDDKLFEIKQAVLNTVNEISQELDWNID